VSVETIVGGEPPDPSPPPPPRRRIALSTAIFALATALSRIAGLAREVVQASFFNTSGAGSAFTIASQIPNLFSNLFSQAALGAAFVPIFTEMLQAGKKREAFRMAASLFWLILVALGLLTIVYMAIAGLVMPLFTGTLSASATGLAWLVATVVQFLLIAWAMRKTEFRLAFAFDWRDPRVRQVLILFFPVTLSIGIINLDIFINAGLGALVSEHVPIAINDAFRIYMLPQGIFSVAVATVLFPTLSRMASARNATGMRRTLGNGIRQINLLLIPSAAVLAVLAVPITRLVYQHGSFHSFSTNLVAKALFWFAFSLPFAGVNLLLSRTFFALQRPWIPTKLAAINVVVDIIVSLALYKPLGIAGPVIGTVVANVVMTWLQLHRLRIGFNGRLEMAQTTMVTVRILIATAFMTALAYIVWKGLDALLGTSLIAQILSIGIALTAAGALYARMVLLMRIPEARQIQQLVLGRLRGRAA
jgi:putative peptidoglycan lipid II flippase